MSSTSNRYHGHQTNGTSIARVAVGVLLGHVLFIALLVGSCEAYRRHRVAKQEAENAAFLARIREESRKEEERLERERRHAPTWSIEGFTEYGVAKVGDDAVLGRADGGHVDLYLTRETLERRAEVLDERSLSGAFWEGITEGVEQATSEGRSYWSVRGGTRCRVTGMGEGWYRVTVLDPWLDAVEEHRSGSNPSRSGYVKIDDVYTKP